MLSKHEEMPTLCYPKSIILQLIQLSYNYQYSHLTSNYQLCFIEEPSKYEDANKMYYNYFFFIFIISVAVVVVTITIVLMLFLQNKNFHNE